MKRVSSYADYRTRGEIRIDADGIHTQIGPHKGRGFPEGKISAPVGSMYIDLASTGGAVQWIKTTGAGTSGWSVLYGDTGWRVYLDSSDPLVTGGRVLMKRTTAGIMLSFDGVQFVGSGRIGLPRISDSSMRPRFRVRDAWYEGDSGGSPGTINISSGGFFNLYNYQEGQVVYGDYLYSPNDSWPSSRPFTPA